MHDIQDDLIKAEQGLRFAKKIFIELSKDLSHPSELEFVTSGTLDDVADSLDEPILLMSAFNRASGRAVTHYMQQEMKLENFRAQELDERIKKSIEEAIGNLLPLRLDVPTSPHVGIEDTPLVDEFVWSPPPKKDVDLMPAPEDLQEAIEDAIAEARVNVAEPQHDEDWESMLPVSEGLPKAPIYLKPKHKGTKNARSYLDSQKRITQINMLPKIEKTEMLLKLIDICDRNHHTINLYKKERRSKWGVILGYIMIIGNASSEWNKGHMMKTAGCIEKLERFIASNNLS